MSCKKSQKISKIITYYFLTMVISSDQHLAADHSAADNIAADDLDQSVADSELADNLVDFVDDNLEDFVDDNLVDFVDDNLEDFVSVEFDVALVVDKLFELDIAVVADFFAVDVVVVEVNIVVVDQEVVVGFYCLILETQHN